MIPEYTPLTASLSSRHKPAHPVVFLFLALPFGVSSGYFGLTLAYLFSKAGVSVEQIAGMAMLAYIPNMIKFLWAPVVDSTLSLKRWYVIAAVVTGLSLLLTSVIPVNAANWSLLTLMVALSSFAATFISAAYSGLMALDATPEQKGRVGGYAQAGNLGGLSLGGGAGLWLADHLPQVWMAGALLALCCVLCCLVLFFVNEPLSVIRTVNINQTLRNVMSDVWVTIKSRLGLVALLLCMIPIGTGAAFNLFGPIAKEWHASADTVAIVTGITGGLVTMVGCLAGGWLCDRMHRQRAFILFGFGQAAVAVGMALYPHTALMYIVWTLLYAFTGGLCYAAFSAFTLEAVGKGAAASKVELYDAVANSPIALMTWVAGLAYTHWGASGMLKTEAVCAVAGALLFALITSAISHKAASRPLSTPRRDVSWRTYAVSK